MCLFGLGLVAVQRAFRPSIYVRPDDVSVPCWPLRDAMYRWDEIATVIVACSRAHPTALWIVPRREGSITGRSWFNWPVNLDVIDRFLGLARGQGVDVVSRDAPTIPPLVLEPPVGAPQSRIVVRAHVEPWIWVVAAIWSIPGFVVIVSAVRDDRLILGSLVAALFLSLPALLLLRAVSPVLVIDRTGISGGVVDRKTIRWDGRIEASIIGAGTAQPMLVIQRGSESAARRIRAPLRLMRMRLSDLPLRDALQE